MSVIEYVEIAAALTIPISVIGVFVNRWHTNKGINARTVQLLAITTLLPIILILALERTLDGASIAALIGALVGYLFSHISQFDKNGDTSCSKE